MNMGVYMFSQVHFHSIDLAVFDSAQWLGLVFLKVGVGKQ